MFNFLLIVAGDYKEAFDYFQKSADQGLSQAMCELGHMYEKAIGVEMDPQKSTFWFEKAASLGNRLAIEKLKKNEEGVALTISSKDYSNKSSKLEQECDVCFENKSNVALLPCGHLFCHICSRILKNVPIVELSLKAH